jgi:hypothetical protein
MENNQLNIVQFGAKTMPSSNTPPTDPTLDTYPNWLAADKYIYAKGLGGVTLKIPPGIWYTSTGWHMKRMSYIIEGSSQAGTFLRTPVGQDGIITNYIWSVGHDSTWYANNFTYNAGSSLVKRQDQTASGNVYRCVTTGTTAASGDALIGNTPGTTYTDGTAQFKFEKYVGPGSFYDYDLDGAHQAANFGIRNLACMVFLEPRQRRHDNQ